MADELAIHMYAVRYNLCTFMFQPLHRAAWEVYSRSNVAFRAYVIGGDQSENRKRTACLTVQFDLEHTPQARAQCFNHIRIAAWVIDRCTGCLQTVRRIVLSICVSLESGEKAFRIHIKACSKWRFQMIKKLLIGWNNTYKGLLEKRRNERWEYACW